MPEPDSAFVKFVLRKWFWRSSGPILPVCRFTIGKSAIRRLGFENTTNVQRSCATQGRMLCCPIQYAIMNEVAGIHRHRCCEEAYDWVPDSIDNVANACRRGKDDQQSEGDIGYIETEVIASQLAEEGVAWNKGVEDIRQLGGGYRGVIAGSAVAKAAEIAE